MDQGDIPLSDKEFKRVLERLLKVAGISLGDSKRTLVVSRLSKIIRGLSLKSFDSYIDYLEGRSSDKDLQQEFVNALTTNLTRFYREDHHFDHLCDHIGALIKAAGPQKRLRIWSAGCSTGQEPYTIGMALLQKFPELSRWDFRILATDIDTNVLAKAATGIYPETELSGLSPQRARPFDRLGDGTIRAPKEIRNLISFKPLNIHERWPVKGPFDAIFCRNVAIYFDKPVQMEMFKRMGELLSPRGFLYIGHSETIGGSSSGFSLVGKTIYKRAEDALGKEVA